MEQTSVLSRMTERKVRFFKSAEIGRRERVVWDNGRRIDFTEPYALPGISMRGTFPPTDQEMKNLTRQGQRAALRAHIFIEITHRAFHEPRRNRRAAARLAAATIWRSRGTTT